ncbi:MAG TPA: right-handed parallel beta-helix repeat-containing protein, partial [bacterium]|nr:right-handed parallel beta-helix repeat-containing protein [bacterium]
ITIDGNAEENEFIDGCRGGGIFLLQCHGIKLKGVTEKNYNGDGISFQQCTKLMIEECEVLNNYGSGLHPGSGSAGVIMRNCKIRGNGKDGVFYCLRVTYTLLEDCEISENGNDGISIGARDTDHIIRSNFITKNCRYGIYFRKADRVMGGHRNLIDSNIIVNNCQKEGKAEVFIEDTTEDIWFKKNKIQGGKNLQFGIIAGKSCKRICLGKDNEFINLKHNVSPDIVFSYSLPRKISVGPEYLNNKSVRHLNIELQ